MRREYSVFWSAYLLDGLVIWCLVFTVLYTLSISISIIVGKDSFSLCRMLHYSRDCFLCFGELFSFNLVLVVDFRAIESFSESPSLCLSPENFALFFPFSFSFALLVLRSLIFSHRMEDMGLMSFSHMWVCPFPRTIC